MELVPVSTSDGRNPSIAAEPDNLSVSWTADRVSARGTYRPALDGLRTIAVYLVLAFHSGWSLFGNGYVGVDMFFVLSGFLITGLLLREWRAHGTISLRNFYARRIRRLLPASLVVLVVGGLAVLLVMSPIDRANTLGDIRASLLWVANWHFIAVGNDYFNAEDAASPFLHFWSLAVEEQYYLVWPAAMLLGLGLARRLRWNPMTVLMPIVVIGIGLSVASAFAFAQTNPLQSYYGTGSRAYQLLAGALLALLLDHGWSQGRRWIWSALQWLALGLMLLVALSFIGMEVTWRGAIVTVATVALIAALESRSQGPVARLLSLPPMAYLGRISYGTYLWHLPVIFVLAEFLHPGPIWLTFMAAGAATALAALSAKVLERPIRSGKYLAARPLRVIAAGVGLSVLIALFGVPRMGQLATAVGVSQNAQLASINWTVVKSDGGKAPSCYQKAPTDCIIVDSGPKAPRINLVGDSHARSLVPVMTALAREKGWTLSATIGSGCPWQWGMLYPRSWGSQTDLCRDLQTDWYTRVIPALKPDVSLLMTFSFTDGSGPHSGLPMRPANAELQGLDKNEMLVRSASRSVKALQSAGSDVVLGDPLPVSNNGDPLRCLSSGKTPESCAFTASSSPIPAEQVYRDLAAAGGGVSELDLDRISCPRLPICDEFVDQTVVRRDADHVTASYWVTQKQKVLAALLKATPRLTAGLPRGSG